jgi:hypothetical protein
MFKDEKRKKKVDPFRFESTAFSFNVLTVVLAFMNTLQSGVNVPLH